ncbi:MAG: Nudix family hydrolase [Pseudomonadota bacterium]
MTRRRIEVVAAAILDGAGNTLVARRPEHVHQGGKLEFPGGKMEPGESPLAALERELGEELGIRPLQCEPLITLNHDYADKSVRLHVYCVEAIEGEPRGLEGQPIAWQPVSTLAVEDFPAANAAIIQALQLPRQLMVTPDLPWTGDGIQEPLEALSALIERHGPTMVLLRQPRFPQAIYRRLATLLAERFEGVQWLKYSDTPPSGDDQAGWHLRAAQLDRGYERDEVDTTLLSASVHTLSELRRAETLGVDFVVLGSVRETPTHPAGETLGWDAAARLVAAASVPVYLIGGLSPDDAVRARESGAQGIAGIRCFTA